MVTERVCFLVIKHINGSRIEPIKVFERIADATNFVKARNKEDKVYYYSIEIVPMKYIDKDEIV